MAILDRVPAFLLVALVIGLVPVDAFDPLLVVSIPGNYIKDLYFVIGSLLVV